MRKQDAETKRPSRRTFLKRLSALPMTAVAGGRTLLSSAKELSGQPHPGPALERPPSPVNRKFVAIQVGAVSFVDEGVDKALDIFQERAGVNALMLAVFTYGRGIAGRQVPGQPLPDHGAQQYDTDSFRGGAYWKIHPQYYTNRILKDFRAPDVGEFDVLEAVVPKAKARGIKNYCWFEDVYNPRWMVDFEQVAEVDVHGRRTAQACLNHPEVRNLLTSMAEDWIKSYEVDGIMWGSERQGPFNNALGANLGAFQGRSALTCFCEFCRRKAELRGINVTRAQEGLLLLERWVQAARNDPRPSDGYFVTLWRVLLDYPEILAWEKFWSDSQQEIYGLIYASVKNINREIQVGWHIYHLNSFSPFFRAEQDYAKLSPTSDFLKVVMYNNCGGPRFAQYIRNVQSTLFRDATPEQALDLHSRFLGYEAQPALDQLPTAGLSADYVARETRRAIAGVSARVQIYPGIDIDIPTGKDEKKTQPADVRAAVKAALTAGAPGVVLSRKYSEMKLANLSAAGEALRELGFV